MKQSNELIALVGEILDACSPTVQPSRRYAPPPDLFRAGHPIHPIPFFGHLPSADVITIAVNPSSTEFEPWRNWGRQSLAPAELSSRLLGYFKSASVPPHPWFAEIEEALNIIGCSYFRNAAHTDLSPRATRSMRTFRSPNERQAFLKMLIHDLSWLERVLKLAPNVKLVVLVGKVLDEHDARGIGLREFLANHASPTCLRKLEGKRWPKVACSKSQLARRVFEKRELLLEFLGRPAKSGPH